METFLTILKLKMTIIALEQVRAGNENPITAKAIDFIIDGMRKSIPEGRFGTSRPVCETCEELGIPCTVEAIQAYCGL